MAFTYAGDGSTTRDQTRIEIGDIDQDRVLFQDAELDYILDEEGDDYEKAAARCCEVLATRFAREATFSADGLSVQKSNLSVAYRRQARDLRARAGGSTTVTVTRKDGYSTAVDADDVS